MRITEAVPKPTFANHESFHLRFGWLKKAYDAVKVDDSAFLRDNATITLGVGKNMVRSIRFWAITNKILEQKDRKLYATDIGNNIFDEKIGLDPYLEDPQTLWLLHWLLFAPPCRIPVWWIILNEITATNIRMEELRDTVHQKIRNTSEWQTPSPKSIDKDISVFIHTYTTNRGKLTMEDYLDCPFRQMRMIRQSSRESMRFIFGKKHGMTPKIVAFAALDFVKRLHLHSKSISVIKLATDLGGVGNTFKLGENELADMLNDALRTTDVARMETVNGVAHMVYDDAEKASMQILRMAYENVEIMA